MSDSLVLPAPSHEPAKAVATTTEPTTPQHHPSKKAVPRLRHVNGNALVAANPIAAVAAIDSAEPSSTEMVA